MVRYEGESAKLKTYRIDLPLFQAQATKDKRKVGSTRHVQRVVKRIVIPEKRVQMRFCQLDFVPTEGGKGERVGVPPADETVDRVSL